MKRILALFLAILLVFTFIGCGNGSDQQEQDAKILAERRDIAESYMRKMATVLWRATEDITYSHAAGGPNAFLEYAGKPDENGIYPISGLTWHALNGANKTARIGNDCASAVGLSWGQLGNSLVQDSSTKYMTTKYGYLRVGEYESNDDAHTYNYDAQLGENVYQTYIIDKKYTFFDLFSAGYLPVTCKELIDPAPVVEESVSDSLSDHTMETST